MALDMSSKLGGIPVPVIGGIIGLGLVGVLYFRSARSSAASAGVQTVAIPDVGPGDQVDSTGTQDGGIGAAVAEFVSNGTWTATALGWETSTYGTSPLTVQAAISNYLEGSALTAEQGAIINRIVGKYGLPPQGVNGISTITPKTIKLLDPSTEKNEVTPTTGVLNFRTDNYYNLGELTPAVATNIAPGSIAGTIDKTTGNINGYIQLDNGVQRVVSGTTTQIRSDLASDLQTTRAAGSAATGYGVTAEGLAARQANNAFARAFGRTA